MESEEVKGNVMHKDIWKRAVYMLVLMVAYSVAEFILAAIVLFQFLMVLITKETNQALKDFSVQLCRYIYEIVRFLSFNTEYRPFPFNPWPHGSSAVDTNGGADSPADNGSAELNVDTSSEPESEVDSPNNDINESSGDAASVEVSDGEVTTSDTEVASSDGDAESDPSLDETVNTSTDKGTVDKT